MAFDINKDSPTLNYGDPSAMNHSINDAFSMFQNAINFQKQNAQMAYLPQQLYTEALMQKLNAAKAMRPLDLGLINHLNDAQMRHIKEFQDRLRGVTAEDQSQATSKVGAEDMAKPAQQPQKPQGVQEPGNSPNMAQAAQDELLAQRQPPAASAAPAMIDPSAMMAQPQMPQQAAQQPAMNLQDPALLQKMSQGLDVNQLMSPETDQVLKEMLSANAMMNRYLPTSEAKVASQERHDQSQEKIATGHDKAKVTAAGITHSGKPGAGASDDKKKSEAFNSVFKPFVNDPYLVNPNAPQNLAAAIDGLSDPDLKARALANPTWKSIYDKYGKNKEAAQTPQAQMTAEEALSKLDASVKSQGFPMVPGPNGRMMNALPAGRIQGIKAVLKKQGLSEAQITQHINTQYLIVPGN